MKRAAILGVMCGLALASAASGDATFGFYVVASGVSDPNAAAASQFRVVVSDGGAWGLSNTAKFRFENLAGGVASSITEVYFQDGTLLADQEVVGNSSGVSYAPAVFNQNQNAVLPGDNTFTRQTTIAGGGLFAADAPLTPTAPNGIAPGEWLEVRFKLVAGYDFEDTIAAMTAAWTGPGNGQLRLGIHVQAFENGGSLSFIDNPIPLPSGGVMGMAGMGLLCFRRRRGV